MPSAEWFFAGTNAFSASPHTTNLLQIVAEPSVQIRFSQTLDTFATNAPRWAGWQGAGKPDASRLRVLLGDLIAHGFVLNRHQADAGKSPSWVLRPRVPSERIETWKKNLAAWFGAAGPTAVSTLSSMDGWQSRLGEMDVVFVNLKAGPVLIVGPLAKETLATLAAHPDFDPIRAEASTPEPDASGNPVWFRLRADAATITDLNRLTRRILGNWIESSTGTAPNFPGESGGVQSLELTLASREGFVRTQAAFQFDKPQQTAPEPWQVPTNSIHDPLISFSGFQAAATPVQRVFPWLAPLDFLGLVGMEKETGQIYSWGLGDVPFQSYVALPLKDAKARMAGFAAGLESRWGAYVKQRSLGQIRRDDQTGQVSWLGGLPMAVPYVALSRDAGYLTAGIFPMIPGTNSMPRELLGQIQDRANLVYYHWEITQGRLVQWKLLGQLLSMTRPPAAAAAGAPVPGLPLTPAAVGGGAWLNDLGKHLGNSVTEISVKSPTELVLTRKSHGALTALEWVLLDNWISNPGFPMFDPIVATAVPTPAKPAAPRPPSLPAFPALPPPR